VTLLLWTLTVVGLLALVWSVALSCARVRRLHRLHIRTDAARDGLESALERRAAAALAVAEVLGDPPHRTPGLRVAVAGARAAGASDGDREGTENVLGRALAAVDRAALPPAVLEELVDAEQLLILARRVHNDAVRDTRALRSRRLVRWLRLAGTAPMPAYFEIADADAGVTTAAPERQRDRPMAPPA
jgi:hypothetical protein